MFMASSSDVIGDDPGLQSVASAMATPCARNASIGGNWLSRSTLEPGADGFVRSMIRGLMRERKAHDMALTPPFELIQHGDGALVLHDPLTQRQILLQAFGPTNAGSFARYLTAPTQAAQL